MSCIGLAKLFPGFDTSASSIQARLSLTWPPHTLSFPSSALRQAQGDRGQAHGTGCLCHPEPVEGRPELVEGYPIPIVTLSLACTELAEVSKGILSLMRILFFFFSCATAFAQPAPLSQGTWIKISVSQSGVYKLDKAFFEKYAPAFASANPAHIRVYGGHATALPQLNSAERIVGLQEIPVSLNDQNQVWDTDDFIAFYARGPHTVSEEGNRFTHQLNPYSHLNYYFITVSDTVSLRVPVARPRTTGPVRDHLPYYAYEEKELKNLLNSGRLWLGEMFRSSYLFSPLSEDFVSDYRLDFELYPMGISRQFLQTTAGTLSRRDTLNGAPNNPNDNQARYYRMSNAHPFLLSTETPPETVQLQLSAESVGNVGVYFNYWSATYNRRLRFYAGRQVLYRTLAESAAYRCQLSAPAARVWQVTEQGPTELPLSAEGIFSPENTRSDLVVFDPAALPYPAFTDTVAPQRLRNGIVPELLVVFPEKFRDAAQRLIQFKKENEDLEVAGYSLTEIYNEFSSGKTDPTAIRDFCRYLYEQAPEKFRHLLLLGDASFDYKNNHKADYVDTDLLVPSYQSRESLEPVYSFASDDYFAFLDPWEGEWPEGKSVNNQWISTTSDDHFMDISVGRIPARTLPELNNYIAKYKAYVLDLETAHWHNRLAFVADNRDYNLHQRDAEDLETLALSAFPGFINDKLYLDDYPVSDGTAPEATRQLHELMNNGTYLITYIGHGAEDGLTNEKLLALNDILTFRNAGRLPVWFTATCQFGKFDNPGVVSGAELMLLRPQTGAIALLTTTRPVYSSTNQAVNQAFFRNIRTARTLGELFRVTKNRSVRGEINRNFSLLGDPSLPLPRWLSPADFTLESDTLTAYRKTAFSGRTEQIQNGSVLVSVTAPPGSRQTLGTFSDGPAFTYTLNSEVIFSGRFPVKDYAYTGEIILPAVALPGAGRVVMHSQAADSSLQEFSGVAAVILAPGNPGENHDLSPPEMTATLAVDGFLTWNIRDESGIHVSDTALTLEVNGETILNPLRHFTPLAGGMEAEVRYYTGHLENGTYQSTLIASDIYNNTARKTFEFQIERPALKVLELTAYPNPVTDYLRLKVRHNRPGDNLDAVLILSDVLGRELYREEFSCTRCEEEIQLESDFYRSIPLFSKVFYRLMLRTENHTGQAGGTLFFSK